MFKYKNSSELPQSPRPTVYENAKGKVGIPILLYFLGVPGIVVIALWAIFFRG